MRKQPSAKAGDRPATQQGRFVVRDMPRTPRAAGFGFVTDGKIDIYVPAPLVSLHHLTAHDIGAVFDVEYIARPGSRYAALRLTRAADAVPAASAANTGTSAVPLSAAVTEALARVEDALDDLYKALGMV